MQMDIFGIVSSLICHHSDCRLKRTRLTFASRLEGSSKWIWGSLKNKTGIFSHGNSVDTFTKHFVRFNIFMESQLLRFEWLVYLFIFISDITFHLSDAGLTSLAFCGQSTEGMACAIGAKSRVILRLRVHIWLQQYWCLSAVWMKHTSICLALCF